MAAPILSRLSPADLLRERLIGSIDISRDGELVAYAERTVVGGKDRSSLWLVPFAGGRARRLTHGAWTDGRPRFSPDGHSLAFLSDREKAGVSQLLLLPLDGGDARAVTAFRHGVLEAEWMPDGRSLAVLAHDDRSHVLQGERDGDETATVRVLRRLDWRMDGEADQGHLVGRGPAAASGRPQHRLCRQPNRQRDRIRPSAARGRAGQRPGAAAIEAAR
jgi:dipeptidyl aminopeptidase/acylaminoacyl peptidase